ncbi:MAG: alpha/beta hydrolase family esterase [Vitreoscilla sp.]
MTEHPACPLPARRSRLASLACALAGALALALSMAPAQAVVDVGAVTLLGPDGVPASAPAHQVMPEAVASAASDALLGSSMLGARTSAGAMPERGNVATAHRRRLAVGGLDRSYLVQPAPGVRGAGRLPVVVLLHGGAQSAEDIWRETSLPTLGAREGFLVVAPEALARHWNDARGVTGASAVDDVRFLKAVIADVIAQDHGDPSAVFMVGSAHGGFMTMRFACDAGEGLRAAASLLSTLPDALARNCKSPRPLPWLAVNGTDDPAVPFGGQVDGTVRRGETQAALRSADDTFRFWADRAGCAAPTAREAITDQSTDERHRWAERIVRSHCVGGQLSQQVVLHGSGHVIPGLATDNRLAERAVGPAAPEIDGGTLVWMHFKATLLK